MIQWVPSSADPPGRCDRSVDDGGNALLNDISNAAEKRGKMAYCGIRFFTGTAVKSGDGTEGKATPTPRHMAGESHATPGKRAHVTACRAVPSPAREPEFDPYAIYPPLPRLVRPLFPDAPYDRDEYMSAVESLFDVTGAVGVFFVLGGGVLALAFLMRAELVPMLLMMALAGLARLVANAARDVLAARYRAVVMQEHGARLFEEFMARENSGRLAYRDCTSEASSLTPRQA